VPSFRPVSVYDVPVMPVTDAVAGSEPDFEVR
jgi:hypothetical protein